MITDYSRHFFCQSWLDEEQRIFLDARRPYRFRAFRDNVTRLVKAKETLFSIAGAHFAPLPRPAGLWWVIADFQPNPILDPTVELIPGSVLVLPSHRTLHTEIFNRARASESRV